MLVERHLRSTLSLIFRPTADTSLDMTKQLKMMVQLHVYTGGNLVFLRMFSFAIFVGKNWLFTEIKRVLFRAISVFLMYISLHKL